MPMPYTIERYQGPGSNWTNYKVYPDGLKVIATAEEVQIWGHVQTLEKELEEERATAPAGGGKAAKRH